MSKKLLQYYQSKMQTGGKVLPLYAASDPIPSRYAPIPRASDIRLRVPMTPIRQTAAEARVARAFNNETIRAAQPQNKMSKALSIAANPATAASYVVRGQRIPDNFDRAETNRYDMATSMVNPFSYLKQVVDTKRDLEEGNYGSAAINAMGFLPIRRPNFGRLTPDNIYDNLGQKLSGGKNNSGVYLLRNEPDYVVKFEDPNRTSYITDTPEIMNTNFADAMRDLPDDLPISKAMYQLDGIRSPMNKGGIERATIMNRVQGMAPDELNPAFFQQLPEETIQGMYQNLKTLRNNNLAFDFFGQNYRYNPQTKQLGLIDIGIQPQRKNYWADNVYGASNKNIYGAERSGQNLKEAMRQMFANDFRQSLQPRFDAIDRGEGNMLMSQLSDYSSRGSDNIVRRVTKTLENLDPYAEGGLLTRSVTCSNCGHSWKSVDGGIDPMTCHKCGGTAKMKNGGQHGGLDRWFAEKWVDVKSGKPCGRQEGESRAYPACRPSRRVSSGTPKTSSEMSPAEKAKFKREKTSSQRISYNHKRN